MSGRRKPPIPADRLDAIRSRVPMAALVASAIPVQRAGRREYVALCPFHSERTPSLRIYPDHAHCFGCGWHGNQIGWLIDHARLGFLGAVNYLCNWSGIAEPIGTDLDSGPREAEVEWQPICPVPQGAPALLTAAGHTIRVFNPKRAGERWEWSRWRPAMVHAYRSEASELLGYVLRVISKGGKKFTPTVTYCQNAAGERRWCIVPFARPAPLYGLERLAARPDATVALVEGEKTAEAAQRLLPSAVAMTWPGGSNGHRHVDFTPLRGRKVVCIPDADQPGRDAFVGRHDRHGKFFHGILDLLSEVGAVTRLVEVEPARFEGWDLADADAEGWSAADAMAWLTSRLEVRHAA